MRRIEVRWMIPVKKCMLERRPDDGHHYCCCFGHLLNWVANHLLVKIWKTAVGMGSPVLDNNQLSLVRRKNC
jgi:hypothetical protein